jgi:organizing structure protein 2
VLPLAGLTAGLALVPTRTAFAEEALSDPIKEIVRARQAIGRYGTDSVQRKRKSIYDAPSEPSPREIAATTPPPASGITEVPQEEQQPSQRRRRTPTDRLAEQIKDTRLALHGYVVRAEDAVNNGMTRFMDVEHSFTQTIASLAPPKESNEMLLPGGIYVLVAAMAGSIVSRNRNVLFRFATPIITGVATAHYVIPRTTENVGNLIWKYEKKFPVIADNHIRARDGIKHFIETGKAHSQMGLAMAENKVQEARESVQDWVKKGR